MSDLISRKAAIEAINGVMADYIPFLIGRQEEIPLRVGSEITKLPPAQQWIPIKYRNVTKEERAIIHESDCKFGFIGTDVIVFECTMPKDGQEIWISTGDGCVDTDVCVISDYGYFMEKRIYFSCVVAWMPLDKPEPYKGGD